MPSWWRAGICVDRRFRARLTQFVNSFRPHLVRPALRTPGQLPLHLQGLGRFEVQMNRRISFSGMASWIRMAGSTPAARARSRGTNNSGRPLTCTNRSAGIAAAGVYPPPVDDASTSAAPFAAPRTLRRAERHVPLHRAAMLPQPSSRAIHMPERVRRRTYVSKRAVLMPHLRIWSASDRRPRSAHVSPGLIC